MVTVYGYAKCSACQKAKKFLNNRGVEFKEIDITINPPSKACLKSILSSGVYGIKDLFNRSGQLYRAMNMKDKLPHMDDAEMIDILAKHGKLVKRPIISDGKSHTVGFNEDRMKSIW